MNHPIFEKIERIKQPSFGDIFSDSIELFKKVWLQGFIHLILSFVIMVPLMLILYIPLGIVLAAMGEMGMLDGYGQNGDIASGEAGILVGVLMFVLMLLVITIASAFQLGITAHFIKLCKDVDNGQPPSSSYFMFFKKEYIKKLVLISLAIMGISLLAMALCVLPVFYVLVPLSLLLPIFAFNPELEVSDMIKASFRLGNKIWLVAFGLLFVSQILAQIVGMILCLVGIYFTAYFIYIPLYYLYKNTLGFEDEIAKIEEL